MKKRYLRLLAYSFLIILTFPLSGSAQQDRDFQLIREALQRQQEAWNQGDLSAFMDEYWKSEQLQFIGARGPAYGWQSTLERYQRTYPDREAMGVLSFDILSTDRRSRKVISLVGKFHLSRSGGDLSGYFLLIWQKIRGRWVIVADHTS